MNARFASPEEVQTWNEILARKPSSTVFSTYEYAEIKKLTHYTPRFIMVNTTPVLALEKKAWPFGKFWYLPKGPGVDSVESYTEIVAAIRQLAKKNGVFMIRTESELPLSSADLLKQNGFIKAAPIIPSQSTILLDISQSVDDILTTLPQKGRYAIRRAGRDGVTVKKVDATDENCSAMYKLLADTAQGQFGIRNYDYYRAYWQTFSKSGIGQLFFAYYEGALVAGAYALVFDGKSTYKDGASARERSAYGASHLLQWRVIEWAKAQGSAIHDLCGSPPSASIHDTTHPHYNIGLFKTSFNKTVTDYIGCYDDVLSPLRYKLWNKIGERVHKKLYFKKTHDYYY